MAKPKRVDVEAVQRDLRYRLRTEGAEAAYQALLEVCRSSTAPMPAKATAGTALLRSAGLDKPEKDVAEKELFELTAEELDREVRRIKAEMAEEEGGEVDVFD